MMNWKGQRATFRCAIVLVLVLAGHDRAFPAGAQTPPAGAGPETSANAKQDPKCSFLREELRRLQNATVAVPPNIPANVHAPYASNAREVRLNIVQGKIGSCDHREKVARPGGMDGILASFERLHTLEPMRLQHIDKIRAQVQGASVDVLVDAMNTLYEEEARSFYNFETVRLQVVDRDVVKDFPMLLDLVKRSNLSDELKSAFTANFKFIKYEEAGRLQNGLLGIDKDLGTTFAYVLRVDLGDRASADDKQRKALTKASEETLKKTVESTRLTARITLCLSSLAVLALLGSILVMREVVTWLGWSNVLVIAGVAEAIWILIGVGFFTWIGEYMGLAF